MVEVQLLAWAWGPDRRVVFCVRTPEELCQRGDGFQHGDRADCTQGSRTAHATHLCIRVWAHEPRLRAFSVS